MKPGDDPEPLGNQRAAEIFGRARKAAETLAEELAAAEYMVSMQSGDVFRTEAEVRWAWRLCQALAGGFLVRLGREAAEQWYFDAVLEAAGDDAELEAFLRAKANFILNP